MKCSKCGNYSNSLLDGVGICCSPELQEQTKWIAEEEKHKSELFYALRSRPLTTKEAEEVMALDYHILVRNGQTYKTEELMKIFNDALYTQFKITTAFKKANEEKLNET